ncbi:MAG: MFS transporter [Candidatus Schekmanbacteria bacterium]|nr:MFS transporter [Candidatus Schekmanbacteria bacterium]
MSDSMNPSARASDEPQGGELSREGERPGEYESSLLASFHEGAASAAMIGLGEGYLSAFAISLHVGSFALGILTSIPALVGSLTQLGMVHLIDRVKRRKPLVLISAMLQAISWGAVFVLPSVFAESPAAWLLVAAVPAIALGAFVAPAWNSWIGDLVSSRRRALFFASRERARLVLQLLAVIAGGLILEAARQRNVLTYGFAAVFGLAFLARLVSVFHLRRMQEPPYPVPDTTDVFTFRQFIRRSVGSNFGRFTLYIAALTAAMNIAGPFFALYMLRDLKLSYTEFMATSAVGVTCQALALPIWGKLSDRFGNRSLVALTGAAIPILPTLWLISPSLLAVIIVQGISGIVRSGFNLSTVAFLFDAVTPTKRARCVAYHGITVQIGACVGALAGGALARHLPVTISLYDHHHTLFSNLFPLFILSAMARLIVSRYFLPRFQEVRPVEQRASWTTLQEALRLTPSHGLEIRAVQAPAQTVPPPAPDAGGTEAREQQPAGVAASRSAERA